MLALEHDYEAEGWLLLFFTVLDSAVESAKLAFVVEKVLITDFLKGIAIFRFALRLDAGSFN